MAFKRAQKRSRLVPTLHRRRRIAHAIRNTRAIWHDTMALWHEFRAPITIFLLVVLVGGFTYGELWFLARGEYIELDVRPLLMLELMILEAPSSPPSEWYLIIF